MKIQYKDLPTIVVKEKTEESKEVPLQLLEKNGSTVTE